MKTVGLRELKNRLGTYMAHVRAGETVTITDRGTVIAELSPPRPANNPRAALEEMARRGELTLAQPMTEEERAALYASPPKSERRPLLSGTTAQELLDWTRGGR